MTDPHQPLKVSFQRFTKGVYVLSGIVLRKADPQGAICLLRSQAEGDQGAAGMGGMGGAGGPAGNEDPVCRKGVKHGLALNGGKGQVQGSIILSSPFISHSKSAKFVSVIPVPNKAAERFLFAPLLSVIIVDSPPVRAI